jgi:adenylosuccinate lyase
MEESRKRWLLGNISGAVGTQNALVEIAGEDTARRYERMVCEKLSLGVPAISLHTRTDRFSEIVSHLANLCSSLGEIGVNVRTHQSSEIAEVEEPYDDDRYSSSTMPNKWNPEASEQVQGLAQLARGMAHSVQEICMSGVRDATRTPVLYTAIPQTYMLASRALATTRDVIEGLVVHEDHMRQNLRAPYVLHQAVAERVMIALYLKTGERAAAHTLLYEATVRSRNEGRSLREVLEDMDEIRASLSDEELDRLFDLTTYTGKAVTQTRETVSALRASRGVSR